MDVDASFYAAQHYGMVSLARRSIVRYEAFYARNVALMRFSDPYHLVSGDVIAAFIHDVSAAAKVARGDADAGCAGGSVLDGLAAAFTLARAPFPPELLQQRRIAAAASSPAPRPSPRSAHMPLSAVLLLEDLSLGEFWNEFRTSPFPYDASLRCPFCVRTARSFFIMTILSLRGVDGLRARVLPPDLVVHPPRPIGELIVLPTGEAVDIRHVLRFATSKSSPAGRKKKGGGAASVEFDVFIPSRGFLPGVEAWIPVWISQMSGLPFIFQSFVSPRAGRPMGANAWRNQSMNKSQLTSAWTCLLAPLFDAGDLKLMRVTLHGPRHLFPEIAKQFGPLLFSESDRNELARWSGSEASDSAGRPKISSMADVYAREGPAHDSELAIRFRVFRLVSSFIADRQWRDVVPIQKGISVSFTFLSPPETRA